MLVANSLARRLPWEWPNPLFDPGLRMLPAGSYLILYQQVDKGVEIARVLHGARQWQDLL